MESSPAATRLNSDLSTPLRRQRGKNFSSSEDVKLCKSWLDVSQNAITGTDQKSETFWAKISDSFNSGKAITDEEFRSPSSLQSRWTSLQATVAKFCGVFQSVSNELHSGWSPEDILKEALTRYSEKSVKNQPFTSLSCWEILRKYPKWANYTEMLTKKRSAQPNSRSGDGRSENADPDEPDSVASLNPSPAPAARPEGTKKALKRAKLMDVTNAEKEKHRLQILETTRQKNSIMHDQVAMTLFALDKESAESKEFFQLKRLQYLKQLKAEMGDTV